LCTNCILEFRKKGLTGTEIPLSLLFADVRGSTGIAERMTPTEFRLFLDRFYRIGTEAILVHDGPRARWSARSAS
jgi:adenylate cyclase